MGDYKPPFEITGEILTLAVEIGELVGQMKKMKSVELAAWIDALMAA